MSDLLALAQLHIAEAQAKPSGRSSTLVNHDDPLRQVIVALAAGTRLGEHLTPAAASVQVLEGTLRIEFADGTGATLSAGQLQPVAHQKHSVTAVQDVAFLLTTVTSPATATGQPLTQ